MSNLGVGCVKKICFFGGEEGEEGEEGERKGNKSGDIGEREGERTEEPNVGRGKVKGVE